MKTLLDKFNLIKGMKRIVETIKCRHSYTHIKIENKMKNRHVCIDLNFDSINGIRAFPLPKSGYWESTAISFLILKSFRNSVSLELTEHYFFILKNYYSVRFDIYLETYIFLNSRLIFNDGSHEEISPVPFLYWLCHQHCLSSFLVTPSPEIVSWCFPVKITVADDETQLWLRSLSMFRSHLVWL